ncbi:MAG: hypothetical protein P1T08_12650 [Acidimicrobiia bacterium]|nr:hypothetical protein [Acidimicrobiia bacterium]
MAQRLLMAAILVVVLLVPATVAAQDATIGDPQWIRTGGPIGGLGYDVRMRPDNPDTLLVTDAWAGMFMSTDGGAVWFPVNEGITTRTGPTGDAIPVFCATVDPNDPDIVWAGTQNLRGIFKSVDGGHSWVELDRGVVETDGITFRGITVDPHDSDVVWAAAEISSWAGGRPERTGRGFDLVEGVVYLTTNGGADWTAVWRGDNLARYIWIDPTDSDTVYVSTGIFDREAANSDPETGVPGGEGILKTTDGGRTWTNANQGLGNLYIGSLFMHPDDPQVLLAAAGSNVYYEGTGVYLTTDGAATWEPVLVDPDKEAEGFHSVEFSLAEPDIAYAASSGSVYRSEDGGRTWAAMTPPGSAWGDPPVRGGFPIDIQVDPRDPDRLFINAYGGGNFLSRDGGRSWTVASTGYTGAQIRGVVVDPDNPGRVWVTGRSGLFVSTDGGTTWVGQSPFDPYPTFEGMALAIAADGSMLEADNVGRGIAYGEGQDWSYAEPAWPYPQAVEAFAFAPSNPEVAYAGLGAFFTPSYFDDFIPGGGVLRSDDGGRTWQPANDSLSETAHVTGIAVDPNDPARVFASTHNAGLLLSLDGGASWQTVGATTDLPVVAVAIHPTDPRVVLFGSRGVHRSTDGGETWTAAAGGVAPESMIVDFVFDPTDPGVVFAADIGSGVYRSTDAGLSWEAINLGLRTRAVNDLAISHDGRHLYAATEGEGIYRLDLDGTPPEAAPLPTIPTTTSTTSAPATVTTTSVAGVASTGTSVTTPEPQAADGNRDEGVSWLLWAGAGAALLVVFGLGLAIGRARRARSPD